MNYVLSHDKDTQTVLNFEYFLQFRHLKGQKFKSLVASG